MLLASDELFQSIAVNGELSALATRQALKDGVKGKALGKAIAENMQNPDIIDMAVANAKHVTHTQRMPGWMENIHSGLSKTLPESVPVVGGKLAPMKLITPFVRIAFNISRAQFNYSPAGLARLADTKLTKEKATRVMSEAAIGSAPLLYLIPLASQGLITGGAPKDPAERDMFYSTKKQPYSVKIGDRWYDWRMMGPMAMPFAISAAWNEANKSKVKEPNKNLASSAALYLGRMMMDGSFLAGISSALDALQEPERFGDRFFANHLSQWVPASAGLRFANKYSDPYFREATGAYNRILNGIPIASESLPKKLNALGQDQRRTGLFPKAGPVDPVYAEMERVGEFPSAPRKSVTVKNKTVKLDEQQYGELKGTTGSAAYEQLSRLINSPGYKAMSVEQKKKALESREEKGRQRPRIKFLRALKRDDGTNTK